MDAQPSHGDSPAPFDPGALGLSGEAAATVVRAVDSLGCKLGRLQLVRLLKGGISHDIVRRGYLDNPYRGSLVARSRAEIDLLVRQLVAAGYLRRTMGRRRVLSVTQAGAAALCPEILPGLSRGATGTAEAHGLK